MSRIAAVAPALPEHVYSQRDLTEELGHLISTDDRRRAALRRLHAGTGIETRHTVLPLEAYRDLGGFQESNDAWIEHGTALAARAVRTALEQAELEPGEVDHLFFTSVTGISAPSIDARLVPEVGLRRDVRRVPSFGLGCVAGASGLARVHDYLSGHPDGVALVVSLELCSLTVQRDDASTANLVASGLFGDGAAAVVMVGDDREAAGPSVIGTRSALFAETQSDIGWDIGGTGFRVQLAPGVPDLVDANFGQVASAFLAEHALTLDDIGAWVAHPGGPRILEAFERSLGRERSDFAASWRSLAAIGNLSSASVLHILADVLGQPAGTRGLLFALGPGVSAEFVLMEWP